MLAITDYPAFVIAILVFLAIPGPGNLAMISSTAQGGIRGGLASTFGIIAGDQILLWCAVAGVAALLKAYPAAFATVQWVGAAYLAWMGYKLITAKPGQGAVLQLKPSHFARRGTDGPASSSLVSTAMRGASVSRWSSIMAPVSII